MINKKRKLKNEYYSVFSFTSFLPLYFYMQMIIHVKAAI